MKHPPVVVSARLRRLVFCLDLLVLLAAVVFVLHFTGCAQTKYKSHTRDPQTGITVTRELTATSLFVNRELGKLTLGQDSLEGAKSDQTSAIEALAAIAAKGKP